MSESSVSEKTHERGFAVGEVLSCNEAPEVFASHVMPVSTNSNLESDSTDEDDLSDSVGSHITSSSSSSSGDCSEKQPRYGLESAPKSATSTDTDSVSTSDSSSPGEAVAQKSLMAPQTTTAEREREFQAGK